MGADLRSWLEGTSTRAAAEEGTSAAAVVQGVRSAVRRHLVTGVVALLVGGLGFFLGRGAGGGAATNAAGGEGLGMAALDAFDRRVQLAGRHADRYRPFEAARVYDLLADEAAGMQRSLERLPPGADRDGLAARLAFVVDRFAPGRVTVTGPDGVSSGKVEDVSRGADPRDFAMGDLTLPPGEYRLEIDGVRVPLLVPFARRDPGQAADREPPRAKVEVRRPTGGMPDTMVLVLPGVTTVEYRGPPWSEPVAFPAPVGPFLMDRREVRNRDWLSFLNTLPPGPERDKRVPPLDFAPDPERPGQHLVGPSSLDLPVRGITPEDAEAYCAWRSQRDGVKVRLPTEAEWVVAAGGLLGQVLPGGLRGLREEADLEAPVGSVKESDRSPYGVLGMTGNVREIVVARRTSGGTAEAYTVKGAGAGDEPSEGAILRVRPLAKDARDPRTGFRCVREVR
jgi:formylglycine-generating enzyme required for sulfatase activity